ncbi:hypothetical protein Asch01_00460 [Acinetobacter schindleri]|uniref:hypothetical protein n=1 Tax=Acinetobacter schindleri TaxID=108981 RepID=UPI0030B30DF3
MKKLLSAAIHLVFIFSLLASVIVLVNLQMVKDCGNYVVVHEIDDSAYIQNYNRPLAKVLFLTILEFDIYLKINAYH